MVALTFLSEIFPTYILIVVTLVLNKLFLSCIYFELETNPHDVDLKFILIYQFIMEHQLKYLLDNLLLQRPE